MSDSIRPPFMSCNSRWKATWDVVLLALTVIPGHFWLNALPIWAQIVWSRKPEYQVSWPSFFAAS